MTSTNGPIAESEDPAPKPTRRRFSPEYKLRMVAEYDAAPTGKKGAILRSERLYHSHILEWRAARDAGAMATLTDRRTSPASVHYGTADLVRQQRSVTLAQAYAAHPERFGRRPQPPTLPTAVWINEPRPDTEPQKQKS